MFRMSATILFLALAKSGPMRGRPGLVLRDVQSRLGPVKRWVRDMAGDVAESPQMQLDFDAYRHVPVRENTTEAQKSKGRDAVRALLVPSWAKAGGRVLGSAIPKDFAAQGGALLLGQEAKTPQQLATIAQVLRDQIGRASCRERV